MLWGPYLCVMFLVEVREGITYVQSVLKEVGVEELGRGRRKKRYGFSNKQGKHL